VNDAQLESYEHAMAEAPRRLNEFGFLPPLPPIPIDLAPLRNAFIDFSESGILNPVYERRTARDLHLRSKTMMKLIVWSPLVAVLQKLMGPDLIVWRSQVFYKKPGVGVIDWHQEWGEFRGEEQGADKPAVRYADSGNALRSLTVWFPLQDVAVQHGALQFMPGSNRAQLPYDLVSYSESAFGRQSSGVVAAPAERKGAVINSTLVDEASAVTVEAGVGQPIVFTERTLHRSLPNTSDIARVAVNFRVTSSASLVYPSRLQGDSFDGFGWDVRNHRCVLISGRNRNDDNRVLDATSWAHN
jgi:non-heme Fe2+,alpha-ketoglutarate-dependent halogenase